MDAMLQNAKYACRQLAAQPSFSIVAGLTLALGIGLSTALFSVIDAALLRPLPYPHPEQLVTLQVDETGPSGRAMRLDPSMDDIRRWRGVTSVVSQAGRGRVSGFVPLIVDTGTPERLTVAAASEGFLETYGIQPVLGRTIQEGDARDGAPRVALLGHAYWQRAFGGDPHVLGRDIRIQDQPVTIVGILPAGFYDETAVWQAEQISVPMSARRGSGTPVLARLRPGVTIAQARAALDASASGARVVIRSLYEYETNGFGATIRMLSLAVGLVLIIACVNVAGLMLAHGATRHVELAIRAAIGAGRAQLVGQLLTESVLLALGAGVVGVLLASVSLDSLVALIPLSLPANSPATISMKVLGLALGVTVVTAVLFGLVPALKLSRAPAKISSMLAVGGRTGAPLSKRAGQWLIGIEIALALVLMTGSALIIRSFARLVSADLGFDTTNVLTLQVEPLAQMPSVRREFYVALADALRRLPEVASAGAMDALGLQGGGTFSFARTDAGVSAAGMQHVVLPGLFEALGIHPLAGRLLQDHDRAAGEAIVVNAAAAQQYFGGNALGHALTTAGKTPRQWRVVGVVPDMRHGGPGFPAQPQKYVLPDPHDTTSPSIQLTMVIRLRDGASLSIDRVKHMAETVGPRVIVGGLRPLDEVVRGHVTQPKHRMLLLTLLGSFGLLLTLVGIFSMTAYAVARRTREIGVRIAFGARRGQVVGVMIRDALWPLALGLVAGLAGTYYATRVIASFLYDTTPHDATSLAAVVVLLVAAAVLAAWLPARRAASVDPVTALRAE